LGPISPGFSFFSAECSVWMDKVAFEIIFITAYDQYGIQAIKFSALDYLLKPIDPEEFKSAIQKAKDKISSRQTNHSIQNLLEYIK
jgi:two-component system LytT family response regulator